MLRGETSDGGDLDEDSEVVVSVFGSFEGTADKSVEFSCTYLVVSLYSNQLVVVRGTSVDP